MHKIAKSAKGKFSLLIVLVLFASIGVAIIVGGKAADTTSVPLGIGLNPKAYDITGGKFVSPSGTDINNFSGSITSPFKTIRYAISQTPNGGKIVVRGGVYREFVGTISKNITIQSYPNEAVWLDGSDVVTGWVQDGSRWRVDNWTGSQTLCATSPCSDPSLTATLPTASYDASGLPDMTFIDGVSQTQVVDCNAVTVGRFCVDRVNSRMFIGTNPTGRVVESTKRNEAIDYWSAAASGSKLLGIGIRRYGSLARFDKLPAMVLIANGAENILIENTTFMQSASSGLALYGSSSDRAYSIQVRDSLFALNGGSGITGPYNDSLTVQNNNFYNNNTEHLQFEGANGSFAGMKLTNLTNSTIKNNLFQDNYSSGFWCDLSCDNNKIVGNMARGNIVNGLYYEISSNALIGSNVSYGNGGNGIKASGRNIKIFNNSLYNNSSDAIFAYDDGRFPSQNFTIKNNIVAGGPSTSSVAHLIYDKFNLNNVSSVVTYQNYDYYFRSSITQPSYLFGWQGNGGLTNFTSFTPSLQSQTGRETNGLSSDAKQITNLFTNVSTGDFSLVASSPSINSGATLASDEATAVGWNNGLVHRGALYWKLGSSNQIATAISVAPPVTQRPDLVVDSFSMTPSSPITGNQVVFSAVVRNAGSLATNAGTPVSVGFYIDGTADANKVSWSSNYVNSLGPGQSVTIQAATSASGVNFWKAIDGSHLFYATADFANQVTELNEANNSKSSTIYVNNSTSVLPNIYAQYYSNVNLSGNSAIAGYDAQINNFWGSNAPNSFVPVDYFSVRWTGKINIPTAGNYTFTTSTDDGVRVWLGGNLIIDNWTYHAPTQNSSPTISLPAGYQDLKVEYFEGCCNATMSLNWAGPGVSGPIPAANFFHAAAN